MTTKAQVHHPIFARVYQRIGASYEAKGAAEHRCEMLANLAGRVIEVGAGTGLNFSHYPTRVTEVVAVEPEPFLRECATKAGSDARISIRVVDAVADALPFDTGEFDAGVASLVLCSVPNQASALDELFRVIRPGGELRFYEHVLARAPRLARIQRTLDVVWPLFAGGCHTARDTATEIERAGFLMEKRNDFIFKPAWLAAPASPIVLGAARRP